MVQKTAEKAMDILELLISSSRHLQVKDITERCEMNKTTIYAIDDEKSMLGARCVAAPIFNSAKRPIAAISVSSFAEIGIK